MVGNNYLLWENDDFVVKTPFNPHTPYEEGPHLVVAPKADFDNAWQDVEVSTRAFSVASRAYQIMSENDIAPWFNIQANGNWGLLPGAKPFFHIHIYGRNRTSSWGKPISLPTAPGSYDNEPMPREVRDKLTRLFKEAL